MKKTFDEMSISDQRRKTFECTNFLELYKCRRCVGFQTNFLTNLIQHCTGNCKTQTLFDTPLYECTKCSLQSHSKYMILRHNFLDNCLLKAVKELHNIIRSKHISEDQIIKWFCCSQCNYKSKTARLLKLHNKQKHMPFQLKWFHCDQCGYKTKTKNELQIHIKHKHTPEDKIEWFYCGQCDYKSKIKSNVQEHIKCRHTSENQVLLLKMNSISDLLKKPFSSYSLEEKLKIKQLGRPLPDLDISKTQNFCASKPRTRKFNRNIYFKNNWICGCDVNQAVFCFPCVLFGGELTWTKKGVTDLVHIWEKIKTHEKSKVHVNNVFSYAMLGKSNILTHLNSAYRNAIVEHNEKVDKNRYVLNTIINCIRFCGALELALRGHDESENKGVFRELVNFTSHLDKVLKDHVGKSTVFKGTSKTIQNELLECMLEVYHKEVAKEIEAVEFAAIIVDETTDVSGEFQLVTILRYIVSGNPVERFWNFVTPSGHDAASISDCILGEIDPLLGGTPKKLISQSYDGASVMSEGLNGVQKLLRDKYPLANYVHCYAHQMNLIMSSAASVNKTVRVFFAHLSGLCSFLSTSTEVIKGLDEIVHGRLPRSSPTRWNFHSRGVNTVYEYRKELIDVMETLENSEHIKLDSIIEQAGAYKLRLQNRDFIFWLTIFHKIMPHVETIFKQLQKKNTDSVKVKQDLQHFETEIRKIRDQMDQIIENIDLEVPDKETPPRKKSRTLVPSEKKREAIEICDVIIQQIRTRFTFTGHLCAGNLFLLENVAEYIKKFPENLLSEVVDAYSFLEKNRLKIELQVVYEREELQSVSGAISLLSLISQEEMRDTFQETRKLLEVLVTTPMSTAEAERCFSTLKRIKTFLRNSMKEERLSALGMLSAEKTFINNIENFNKQVIDLFANKEERRMDFNYRAM